MDRRRTRAPLAAVKPLMLATLAIAVATPCGVRAQARTGSQPAPTAPAAMPDWFVHEVAYLTRDGGRWVADNRAYRGEDDPYVAYGIEWVTGSSGLTARGRLFGIDESGAEHHAWELYLYWNPLAGEAVAMQVHADGTFATGSLHPQTDTQQQIVQQFWRPDGSTFGFRHVETRTADEQRSETFIRSGDRWESSRTYIWKRARG